MSDEKMPCPPVAVIAVAEMQGRHQRELAEVLNAARAASDLPDGNWVLNLADGHWYPKPDEPAVA